MLQLTMAISDTLTYEAHEEYGLDREKLESIFNGYAAVRCYLDTSGTVALSWDQDDIITVTEPDENGIDKPFHFNNLTEERLSKPIERDGKTYAYVIKAEWSFAETEFERYVQRWMNENSIATVFGLLEGGIYSGYTELVHDYHAMEVLTKYRSDIEAHISDMCNDMGLDFWAMFEDRETTTWKRFDFSFPKLAVCCFEEKVRDNAIIKLNVDW